MECGTKGAIEFEVTNFHRPVISVAKAVDRGMYVYFSPHGSYIERNNNGEIEYLPLHRQGNLFVQKIRLREDRSWIKQDTMIAPLEAQVGDEMFHPFDPADYENKEPQHDELKEQPADPAAMGLTSPRIPSAC
jgi:hypothetical protein